MFFESWSALARVLLIGTLAYVGVILLLRLSGKRTLAKWSAFDFIVTIALGSTLATIIVSKQVALAEGVAALGLLIGLQFAISWMSTRVTWIRRLTKSDPAYLYRSGAFVAERLRSERVTRSEVLAAVRGAGLASMHDVAAVVLETDGSVSVIGHTAAQDRSALADVV
jgi:uncharacterized membrane protein YcaP (DUF421 family)